MTQKPLPLAGLRIFDLTRILAGPTCTQILGDLGADVIKIERAGAGDDTRKWGPPFLKDKDGRDTGESAYYLSANRNKRSLTLDLSKPEGQNLARRLLAQSDILIENFKAGDLAKYGLAYDQLKAEFPRLIYCSITGFGQTGPYAKRAGYDYLAQGMGGIMSITGQPESVPGSEPVKVGVAIADITTGLYAAVSILAALRHRDATGHGQQIDLALLDTQVSWLANEGMNYLVGGRVPKRLGNAHANIVPYQVFATSDGHIILAIGNETQFRKFCEFAGRPEIAADERFSSNAARMKNQAVLVPVLREIMKAKTRAHWLEGLEKLGVPCGPVNNIDQVFADPQVLARGMKIEMEHAGTGVRLPMIGSPIKMSETSPSYRRAPPTCGEHTDEVLKELLGLSAAEIAALRDRGIV
ncbi:MAG TPA: CaiB/BaiF CoA-transferase family protein [Alphaproteobacteria bacterium]|nr:CaiB/BaiF CoA-transferase family protein [Alphaproteobacteria bacterium]